MNTITINGKEINLAILEHDFEIRFIDEATGLEKVVRCEEITIKPYSKVIRNQWFAYDVTPTGMLVNKQKVGDVIPVQEDYNFFNTMFGQPIKKFSLNGLFRNLMGRFKLSSFAVFDQQLNLIDSQPVPFPEPDPIDDVDISDAFE